MESVHQTRKMFNPVTIVAALGYFVDIYDLQLFNVISKKSILGIGISDSLLVDKYDYILFLWQMSGMLAGGVIWGILGDKRGRKSVLFGSILLYSLANIANAFVVNPEQYAFVRFMAGLGLAGELGAAITLVSEILHKELRGYGTMIIVGMGALGAVAAALVANNTSAFMGFESWQVAYFIGGALGLLLLLLRVGTFESGLFERIRKSEAVKGKFSMLFTDKKRLLKYLACIGIGLPTWFCAGILIKFSEKFALIMHVDGTIKTSFAIMYSYLGLSAGDLVSGTMSQLLKSRKKVVLIFLCFIMTVGSIYLFKKDLSVPLFYFLCFLIGASTGYWVLFVTIASEQFGTNIRSTVTTTVPNFVRGSVVPLTLCFKGLEGYWGTTVSALVIGISCITISAFSILSLKESFAVDLNYIEHEKDKNPAHRRI